MDDRRAYVAIHLFQRIGLEEPRAADHSHRLVHDTDRGLAHKVMTRDDVHQGLFAVDWSISDRARSLKQHRAGRPYSDLDLGGEKLVLRIVTHGLIERFLLPLTNPRECPVP